MSNIRYSDHPSIYINYTINRINRHDIAEFLENAEGIDHIKGSFFYFHTPYYGYDDLFLDKETRNQVLNELLKFKKKYKILNSSAGLQSAIRNDWKKNLRMCQVYEAGQYYYCCRENNHGAVCENCGYLSYAEIDQTMKLKPGAIRNALKYF
jgi:hypothetical protein